MAYRGSRGTCYVYELVDDGGSPHLPGLTDPATLIGCDYDSHRVVAGDDFEAPGRQFEPTSSPRRAHVEPRSSRRRARRCREPHAAADSRGRPLPRYRPSADQVDPASLLAPFGQFCKWLAVRNCSPRTITGYESQLLAFGAWVGERAVHRPPEVTLPVLESYQRALFYRRKPDGSPLTVRAQVGHLIALRAMFRWLAKQRRILYDPASALELPRTRRLLPRGVLTVTEVEQVLAAPDLASTDRLRDRAIIETLYSTAIRAQEAAGLSVFDLEVARGTLHVRAGKGQRERMVPIGDRAIGWVDRHLVDARPPLATSVDDGRL